jgi:hypothetical protein
MTNYVREITTGICECPTATHDEFTVDRAGYKLKKCEVKCSGETPVRDSSSGDCRGYVCADNGDETNSMLDMYEAGKTLTLPSNKCIEPNFCVNAHGYEISGTNCICVDTKSWTSVS